MTGIIREVKVDAAQVNGGADRVPQPGRAPKASADRGLGAQALVDDSDCNDCKNDVERGMFEAAEKNMEVQLGTGITLVD